ILVLQGEQGTAKTWTARLLQALVDPNVLPPRALPRNEHELLISAVNGHVLAFDNVSNLPDWMSDALCRLATGGGSAARRLYSNREQELFRAERPVILNGIEHFVTRQDLADRCIFITLEHIPDERRVPEEDLWAAFKERQPHILGALLEASVEGLHNLPGV